MMAAFALLAELGAKEEIKLKGTFSVIEECIQVVLENHSSYDVVVSGFFEGLQRATIVMGSRSLPFIKNEELIRFDLKNRDVVWLRLRSLHPKSSELGSFFYLSEPVTNAKLLNYLRSNRGDDLALEVVCRWAPLDGTKLGDFSILKLRLSHRVTKQNDGNQKQE